MSVNYTLPATLLKKITNLQEQLTEFVVDQRVLAEQMSERWQEGDRAASHVCWVDALQEFADILESDLPQFEEFS